MGLGLSLSEARGADRHLAQELLPSGPVRG